MESQGARFRKEDFAPLLEKVLDILKNASNISKDGFRICGLCPFQPNNMKLEIGFKRNCNETRSTEKTAHHVLVYKLTRKRLQLDP